MFCQRISQFTITYVLTSSTYVLTDFNIEKWIRHTNGSTICGSTACEGVRALEPFSI